METYRIHEDVGLYYVTFSVMAWLPVFVSEISCRIITESLNFCHHEKNLRINAFVIMPTHLHLIVFDVDFNVKRLRKTLSGLRGYTGKKLLGHVEHNFPAPFSAVMQHPRRTDRARQFWQPSRHPVGLFTHPFWATKTAYLHDNPRRKGLVRESTGWRFSSAAYWLLDPPGETDVLLTSVEW